MGFGNGVSRLSCLKRQGGLMERNLSAEAWAHRYEAADTPWDLAGPAPWLIKWLGEVGERTGRVVVPGCGRGHDALALAQAGFEVVGMDFAAPAIARAQASGSEVGVSVQWVQADWLRLPEAWHAQFDWVFEHTCLCAIAPRDRGAYVESAWRALRPGGHIVGILFTHQRGGGPPFGMSPQDAKRLFESHFDVMSIEPIGCSVAARQREEHALIARRRDDVRLAQH
jgi:SAM-dependent methyltransferase